MPKYRAIAVLDATKFVGEFEVESKDEAEELAWDKGEHYASLCHHCASEIDLGDPIKMVIEEVEDEENE